jgi:hypothetical protein
MYVYHESEELTLAAALPGSPAAAQRPIAPSFHQLFYDRGFED